LFSLIFSDRSLLVNNSMTTHMMLDVTYGLWE